MNRVILALFASALVASSAALDCGDDLVRGVNIGGLFVLEPWITPSIFEEVNVDLGGVVVDEYTYAQYVDPTFYQERLTRHWDEFYSREDLQELYDSGITHVRVPVGYWLVDVTDDEPFPPPPQSDSEGQRVYITRLLGWCEEIGLKVLIDLHAAPGSQNGFDNSGRRGPARWVDDFTYLDRTLVVLDKLTELVVDWIAAGVMSDTTLWGIEITNEPIGWEADLWAYIRDSYYYDAYDVIRARMTNDVLHKVVLQQAFVDPIEFINYMPESQGYTNKALDLHEYHAFGEYYNNLAAQPEGWQVNIDTACDYAAKTSVQTMDVVVGEWSLAITDCQKYLDGGYAEPYVPPNAAPSTCDYYNGDFANYSDDYKQFMSDYMNAQMDAAEAGNGWFFWTAKTEDNCGPEWDYLFLLRNGIAPQNLCERPRICP